LIFLRTDVIFCTAGPIPHMAAAYEECFLSGQSPPLPYGSGLRLWMRQNDSCGGFRDKPGVISFCVLTSRRLTTAISADIRTDLNLVVAINCNHPVDNHHNTPGVVNNTFAPIAVETLGPLNTSTQLNSTENYGRRCLTPLSPHRNYILS